MSKSYATGNFDLPEPMEVHLGVEDIEPGNWVAWVFDFPGCYSRATTREEAIKLAPPAVEELLHRLAPLGFSTGDRHPPHEVRVVEEFQALQSSFEYLVNAFFENDKIPLSQHDIEYAQRLLGLNRHELILLVSELSVDTLSRQIEREVQGNIKGILRHVGTTEWWYWDRLGLAFPFKELPNDLINLLEKVRELTNEILPTVIGSKNMTTMKGEQWSPRKVLRRTIWHERVHTLQIARYLKSF